VSLRPTSLGSTQWTRERTSGDPKRVLRDGGTLRGDVLRASGSSRRRLPGRQLETLLAEIAAFPNGRHDDQVDALSYVTAYRAKDIYEARRWGLKFGRLVTAGD
jgi:hypothetical protein